MSLNLGRYFLAFTIFTYGAASAQTSESGSNPVSNRQNSPYSRYAIGDLRSGTNIAIRGMGSISTATADPFAVNTDNPASYASLVLTTYEAAGEASSHTLRTQSRSYNTGMATLSYVNIGIPISKNLGMALGLRPTSRMYYNVQDSAVGSNAVPGVGNALRIYFGDGSINQAYLGFGGKVKNFSLGFNFGYMFGSMRNTSALVNIDTTQAYNSEVSRYTRVGGLYYNLGAMYQAKLDTHYTLRIGAKFSMSQSLNAERDEYWISYVGLGSISSYDTVNAVLQTKGALVLPMTYGIGAQLLHTNKWTLGVDFSNTSWGDFRNFGKSDSLQANAYRVAVGGEFTPDRSVTARKYFSKVTYRLGFYYGQDYVRLRNTDMNIYAVTAGASLPFRKSPDRIHTALELGSRGSIANGLVKENFVKFTLGVSLNAFGNDRWFVKRKYD
ncbi:MAG: hypothetical protein JNL72_09385 [Flavipsychrobacter sp.]|nr:hypothetical protein [Flavipsychrobacter sp.]